MSVPANLIANMLGAGAPGPVVLSSSAGQTTVAAKNHIVMLPSGIVAGDLVLVYFVNDTTNAAGIPGWTTLNTQPFGASARASVFYIQATGPMSTVTVNTGGVANVTAAWVVRRIRGHKDPSVQPPTANGPATGNNAAPDPASFTLTPANHLLIPCCAVDGGTDCTAAPAGYNDQQTGDSGGSFGHVVASNAWKQANVGTEDPGPFTLAGTDQWAAFTIAIFPA